MNGFDNNYKKSMLAAALVFAMTMTACGQPAEAGNTTASNETTPSIETDTSGTTASEAAGDYTVDLRSPSGYVDDKSYENDTAISLSESIDISGGGATVEGNIIKIIEGGVYTLSGSLSDGMVYVESDENVKLVLSGVSITNPNGSAIYVYSAKNTLIELTADTESTLSDGTSYSFTGTNESSEENEPDACIYSKDDLIIFGGGTLTVSANYNNGIVCKDDLELQGGTLNVTSVNNGICGKESVLMTGGTVNIDAKGDAVKSSEDTDTEKGYITISGGTLNITTAEDGIQAETDFTITGGTVNITTTGEVAASTNDNWGNMGGGMRDFFNQNRDGETPTLPEGFDPADFAEFDGEMPTMPEGFDPSDFDGEMPAMPNANDFDNTNAANTPDVTAMNAEGATMLSATTDFVADTDAAATTETAGTTDADASSKGIKCGGDMTLSGGTITITSTDHAIHSTGACTIDGAIINIASDNKGISAHGNLTVENGEINISKAYEGIESKALLTINGGTMNLIVSDDGLNAGGGSGVPNAASTDGVDHSIIINGGYMYIECGSDGVDANTNITINGGTVIVNGPSSGAEEALDASEGLVLINGGTLAGFSGGGFFEAPSEGCGAPVIYDILTVSQAAGTTIAIRDTESGEIVFACKPKNAYMAATIASDKLTVGKEYEIILGAELSGTEQGGLYTDATISGGTVSSTITLTEGVNQIGIAQGGFGNRQNGNFGGGKRGFDKNDTSQS